ncbi:hypothetical protein PR048_020192 [Dryococelus australis]|uniref:Uncharacterized protein n=1 Tax=Dryococelus australis TaxID=614101 RepID=A0ABQ9H5L6_9NEOP|nr:hypothetical protein PR048_020192 [Dryococelus australis]
MIMKLLRRILERAALHFEDLLTVICECEGVVKSRPLSYVSDDPRDLQPLTPAMFRQETCTLGVPDLHQLEQVDLNKRRLYQQKLRANFRSWFRTEYLIQLLEKWFSGELIRPIQRIYPLEISAPVEELKAQVAHQVEKGSSRTMSFKGSTVARDGKVVITSQKLRY